MKMKLFGLTTCLLIAMSEGRKGGGGGSRPSASRPSGSRPSGSSSSSSKPSRPTTSSGNKVRHSA